MGGMEGTVMSGFGSRDEESHISMATNTRKMHGSEYS